MERRRRREKSERKRKERGGRGELGRDYLRSPPVRRSPGLGGGMIPPRMGRQIIVADLTRITF